MTDKLRDYIPIVLVAIFIFGSLGVGYLTYKMPTKQELCYDDCTSWGKTDWVCIEKCLEMRQ